MTGVTSNGDPITMATGIDEEEDDEDVLPSAAVVVVVIVVVATATTLARNETGRKVRLVGAEYAVVGCNGTENEVKDRCDALKLEGRGSQTCCDG